MALVVDTGILPVINTGIAHKQAGVGQIGAGVTKAPLECFTQAIRALAEAREIGPIERDLRAAGSREKRERRRGLERCRAREHRALGHI